MAYSQKVPELSDDFRPSLTGSKWTKASTALTGRKGWEERRITFLFRDNHELLSFHLAFSFHQNKMFTMINAECNKGPDSSACGCRAPSALLRFHCLLGAVSVGLSETTWRRISGNHRH
jgi:hypothetical protein